MKRGGVSLSRVLIFLFAILSLGFLFGGFVGGYAANSGFHFGWGLLGALVAVVVAEIFGRLTTRPEDRSRISTPDGITYQGKLEGRAREAAWLDFESSLGDFESFDLMLLVAYLSKEGFAPPHTAHRDALATLFVAKFGAPSAAEQAALVIQSARTWGDSADPDVVASESQSCAEMAIGGIDSEPPHVAPPGVLRVVART